MFEILDEIGRCEFAFMKNVNGMTGKNELSFLLDTPPGYFLAVRGEH